jgi:hypothetical protein
LTRRDVELVAASIRGPDLPSKARAHAARRFARAGDSYGTEANFRPALSRRAEAVPPRSDVLSVPVASESRAPSPVSPLPLGSAAGGLRAE